MVGNHVYYTGQKKPCTGLAHWESKSMTTTNKNDDKATDRQA